MDRRRQMERKYSFVRPSPISPTEVEDLPGETPHGGIQPLIRPSTLVVSSLLSAIRFDMYGHAVRYA